HDATRGGRGGCGTGGALRPPYPGRRGGPRRHRLAPLRAGAGGARRRNVPGHSVPASAAAPRAHRRGAAGGAGVSGGDARPVGRARVGMASSGRAAAAHGASADRGRPALAPIRALGLAAAIPALGLDDRPVELTLRGYTPGLRATLEVRAGDRHFALKLYAEDPQPEAELYEALAAVGLVGEG